MSIKLSVLKRSIRPRSKSLTRGWVTRRILAAFACLSPREAIAFHADRDFRVPIRRLQTDVSEPAADHIHL